MIRRPPRSPLFPSTTLSRSLDERAGDPVTDRPRLAGDAAAVDLDGDIETADQLHRLERLAHDHSAGLAAEELFERTVVHRDAPAAGLQVHARRRGLATPGSVVILLGRWHVRSY